MADSAFIRDESDDWDDGWSRAPHGLWTLDVPNGAKVLLGWLHSHSSAFLPNVTVNQARRAVGSSSILAWFEALEGAGFISIRRRDNGSSAQITLKMAPWKALIGHRDRAEIGSVTAPKSARIEEQGEDHLLSSLRSESELIAEDRVDTRVSGTPHGIAKEYHDWHVADRGKAPTTEFKAIMGLAKRLLKSGYEHDEIVDALKNAKVHTAKALSDDLAAARHKHADTPNTQKIPASIVRAFAKCEPWFERRGLMQKHQTERAYWMRLCASQVNFGYGPGETMLRMAIALRTNNATAFALSDAKVERFNGELADYPDAMERAYTNREWSAR